MYAMIFHVVLSAVASFVAGYMQIKGIGSSDLIGAIAAVAGGNGVVAVKNAVQLKQANNAAKEKDIYLG